MKNISVQTFKMGCNKTPTSRIMTASVMCGGEPLRRVPLHISAAKEAGDVTGLTSRIPKSPNRYQKRFICNDSSFAFTTISFLNHFLQSCYLNFNLTKKVRISVLVNNAHKSKRGKYYKILSKASNTTQKVSIFIN